MFIKTPIADLVLFQPNVIGDERGYFYESYSKKTFADAGIFADFIQDNQARSIQNVLRGLHFQTGEFAQAKLVRCTEGAVLDVAVDLRPASATYTQCFSVVLSAENHTQLFVPRGFAHGYAVLTDTAVFQYKCDNLYSKAHEGGIRYNDPTLAIDWQIDLAHAIISEKDLVQPLFEIRN